MVPKFAFGGAALILCGDTSKRKPITQFLWAASRRCAYARIKKDGLVDKNGIDTWRYSDTLDNTEDFFPKENLKSLNDIFTDMSC